MGCDGAPLFRQSHKPSAIISDVTYRRARRIKFHCEVFQFSGCQEEWHLIILASSRMFHSDCPFSQKANPRDNLTTPVGLYDVNMLYTLCPCPSDLLSLEPQPPCTNSFASAVKPPSWADEHPALATPTPYRQTQTRQTVRLYENPKLEFTGRVPNYRVN